jgi:sec-independent protein translocase protein TatA
MFRQLGAPEIIVILIVVLLLFGAKRLPDLARSIGEAARELRAGMRDPVDETEDENSSDGPTAP